MGERERGYPGTYRVVEVRHVPDPYPSIGLGRNDSLGPNGLPGVILGALGSYNCEASDNDRTTT